jgi:hypothetical protein
MPGNNQAWAGRRTPPKRVYDQGTRRWGVRFLLLGDTLGVAHCITRGVGQLTEER